MGGLTKRPTQVLVPKDMEGLRSNQIDLIQRLLKPDASGSVAGNINSYFGGPSPLQRQATNGISQFLNQLAPEQRALDISMPALQEILSGNPADNPQFQRDISAANATGGRFGSANAIMRGEAFRNLFNSRTQAASTLGVLASAAGQNPFARLTQAEDAGNRQTMNLQALIQAILGTGQAAAFNLPITQGQSPLDVASQVAGIGVSALGAAKGGAK